MGLYEFGVTVGGEDAHGEAYVNVTVKPGECGRFPETWTGPDEPGLVQMNLDWSSQNQGPGAGLTPGLFLTEPRVNKPPVAMVSPRYQEISLPTSSTVIDGSRESLHHTGTGTTGTTGTGSGGRL